jgi:ATP-dependent RNA circularization protein (DNA/RNA ligase family)
MENVLFSDLSHTVAVKNDKMDIVMISSKIIERNSDHVKNLLGFFDKTDKIVNLELLYRASDNDYDAVKFHQKCDQIPHTLVIAKTEHKKIIGGYTPS